MVAEAVQEELESYKSQEDEVRRLKKAMVCICISVLIDTMYYINLCII